MASSDQKHHEQSEQGHDNEASGGFMDKVKGLIQDVGDKLEETVGFGKPTADVTSIHIPSIDLKTIELVVDVLVQNPNPIPIPLCDINYTIESDGRKLVSGLIPDAGTIKPHGSETIKLPFKIVYDDIKETYKEIKEGSIIPYKVLVQLIMDVPVFGQLTFPLEKKGEIPVPYKPEVDLVKVKFEEFSFEETSATLHLKLMNKNEFDMGLNSLEYQVWLGEEHIGGAKLDKSTKIEKNGEGIVEIPISFRPKDFGSALWDMISGKGTGYSIKGSIEVDSVFGPMVLPFSKEGGSTKLKKADDNDDDDDWLLVGSNVKAKQYNDFFRCILHD